MNAAVDPFDLFDRDDVEPDYEEEAPALPDDELQALQLADWHARQVTRIREEAENLRAQFDAEIARITIRRDARLGVLAKREAWHLRPILGLHRAILARTPKRKTIHLPSGPRMKSRAQQPAWEYPDEAAFLEWAAAHEPHLIAPRSVGVNVPQELVATVETLIEAALSASDLELPTSVLVAPARIDRNAAKAALAPKETAADLPSEAVHPTTGEVVPGVVVTVRSEDYTLDTTPEA